MDGTLVAVFRVRSLHASCRLLDNVVGGQEERRVSPFRHNEREETNAKALLAGVDFTEFVFVKVHTGAAIVKRLSTYVFAKIWTVLTEQCPETGLRVADFLQTYPMRPSSFSGCSLIVMNNQSETLRHVDMS